MKTSASGWPGLAIPKGTTRKTEKGREDRHEAAVVQVVRPQVMARDGACRFLAMPADIRTQLFDDCYGRTEWAHYNATHRRSKTMGQPPEMRHTVEHSMALCQRHSQAYDQNRIRITELTERGCNGLLRMEGKRGMWEETE